MTIDFPERVTSGCRGKRIGPSEICVGRPSKIASSTLPSTSPTKAAAAVACASRRSPLASLRQGERPAASSVERRTRSSFLTKLANSQIPRLGQSLMRFISEQLVGANESEPIATYPTSTLDHSLTESSTRPPDGPNFYPVFTLITARRQVKRAV